jgi:hypothetical protein
MRRAITARKLIRRGPDDEIDPEFWAGVAPAIRFAETWRLSEEIWRLKGWDPGEPGLLRSVARLVRRGR